jgi:hypothetical protein
VTRFWADGLLVTVMADALAAPTAFIWQGATHTVEHIAKR